MPVDTREAVDITETKELTVLGRWIRVFWPARREATIVPGLQARPQGTHLVTLITAALLVTALFGALAYRLFHLQIVRHSDFRERDWKMHIGVDRRGGRRGDIVLRDGTIVARQIERCILAMDPQLIAAERRVVVVNTVAEVLGFSESRRRDLQERLRRVDAGSRPSQYLALARDLEVQDASRVMEVLTPHLEPGELNRGLMVRKVHFREYPRGALLGLGPVVGWVRMGQTDTEQVGASGLEYKLESYLSCLDGQRKVYCDAQRTTRFCGPESIDIAAIHGYTVHATIDSRVQRIAEEELQSQLTKMEAEAGVTIVMNCRNGDVLGMVSLPGFDPNRVGQYPPEELARRRKNRAVENEHEPGSTIKPFIVATALERGVVNRHETIWGGGKKTKILKRTVRDVHDHGPITVEDAVVFSSNIGAALIGLRLGAEGLNDALDLFHFQERSGIRLPGEARGRRESRRNWSDRFTSISVSFGYNVTMSPIQLAAAYCSLVNGGTYYRPRLVARLERDDEVLRVPTETLGQSVSPAVSATMREILHRVVEEGTGRFHKIDGLSYGGKTGTAAISKGKRGYAADGRKEYLSSYCAFAPYHGRDSIPEIVIIVMVEKSKKSYYGSTVCGPVVTGILKRLYGVDEMSHRVASSPQRKD